MKFLSIIKNSFNFFVFLAFAVVFATSEIAGQKRDRVIDPKNEAKKDVDKKNLNIEKNEHQHEFTKKIITVRNRKETKSSIKKTFKNKNVRKVQSVVAKYGKKNKHQHGFTKKIIIVKNKKEGTSLIKKTSSSKLRKSTNKFIVVGGKSRSLVKKTFLSKPVKSANTDESIGNIAYSPTTRSMMLQSIKSKIGLRYSYGSQGSKTYDCSGFVWKVFQESGISFTRTSARYLWKTSTPVYGKDRFRFGTLVFFNRLRHVGIVVDENGFYHASRSKGITYSKFKGYWSKRIVGFRRVPLPKKTSSARFFTSKPLILFY